MTKKPVSKVFASVLVLAALALPSLSQDLAVAVKEVQPFPYLAISHTGPYTDMGTVIGQLVCAFQAQGLFAQIRGPMVGVYYDSPAATPPDQLSWEVGFVVTAQTTAEVPLMKKVWEHKTVAAALYVGPYDGVGPAIGKITAWIAANGYAVDGPVLERYLDQNPSAMDPSKLRTEIWIPVTKR